MSQLEKQTGRHELPHMWQYQQDLEVHYDYVQWINIYMGLCITRKESNKKVSVQGYVHRGMLDWTREFWSWNHRSAIKHKRRKRGKIKTVIILEKQIWGKFSRSAVMVSNVSSWNHFWFVLSNGRISDWFRQPVLNLTILTLAWLNDTSLNHLSLHLFSCAKHCTLNSITMYVEVKILLVKCEINRDDNNKLAMMILSEQAIPCVLHMDNHEGEKIICMWCGKQGSMCGWFLSGEVTAACCDLITLDFNDTEQELIKQTMCTHNY